MATATKTVSNNNFDFQSFYQSLNGKPRNLRLTLAAGQIEYAARGFSLDDNDLRDKCKEAFDTIKEVISISKKRNEQRYNQGPAEINLPNQSTSGDSGKIALAKHEVPMNLRLDSTIEPEPEVVEKK